MAVSIVRSVGSVRLRNTEGTGCSWGGMLFEPDANGVVEVPIEALEDLRPHGFDAAPPKQDHAVTESEVEEIVETKIEEVVQPQIDDLERTKSDRRVPRR